MALFLNLPQDIENLILEYNQDPDQMILMNHGRSIINRFSNKIKEIGGIVMMKHLYPLYHHGTITESGNKELYYHGKLHYMEKDHYLIQYNKIKNKVY
jgi:hypothetical protein